MIAYTPQDAFTDTEIYDLTDLVKGGVAGTSNVPLEALLDRSLYLFNRLASYEGIKANTGSYVYDPADARKHFVFTLTDNATFTLPDVTTLRVGAKIPIRAMISAIKALTVQCAGTQIIKGGGIFGEDVSAMFMHNAESLCLEAAGDHWEVLYADGNFYLGIGETFPGRIAGKNMLVAQGQLVNRADVPRLAAFALSLGSGIVADSIWLSDPGGLPVYRGCYSTGNTTTTLRIPDERGMFTRYLDSGRGIDNDRQYTGAGGYEADQVISHTHNIGEGGDRNLDSVATFRAIQSNTDFYNLNIDIKLKPFGGSETRPKNIGKLPLIRY